MSKQVWVDCRPWSKKKVLTALENGADAVIVPTGRSPLVKELGRLKTVAPDGDIRLGEDAVELSIQGKEDEVRALDLSKNKVVIVSGRNWKIIPLDNLVAQANAIFSVVDTLAAAKTALSILERGVAGIVVRNNDIAEIKMIIALVKSGREKLALETVRVDQIRELALGDRVCVDTCTNMRMGEGMLVGNAGSAFFLVQAESVENPYVKPRPFRVNAGGVHAYTLRPGGKTSYLDELSPGDEVLVVDHRGKTQVAVVGRLKVEKRPLLLVSARMKRKQVSLILQNAETIRLVRPSGKPISVASLREGDEVLAYFEEGGRHFGIKVRESIVEK